MVERVTDAKVGGEPEVAEWVEVVMEVEGGALEVQPAGTAADARRCSSRCNCSQKYHDSHRN